MKNKNVESIILGVGIFLMLAIMLLGMVLWAIEN